MSYVIFSIDNWYDIHTLAKFTRHVDTLRSMSRLKGEVKVLVGCYDDRPEISFICTESDFNNHLKDLVYLKNQECFLHVSEEKQMPAYLVNQSGEKMDSGRLETVAGYVALATHSSWSYRPDLDRFFVMD